VKKSKSIAKRKLLWRKNEFDRKFAEATGRELPKDLQRNHRAIQRALKSYVPQPFDGAMTIFRATKQPYGAVPDATLGWDKVVRGPIDVYEVPGSHGAVTVDPYARFLAEKLTPCLERAYEAFSVAESDAPSLAHV
jgi:thioesterase domain-containing protein